MLLRFGRNRSGSTAVEFAIVFPLLLTILAATVDLGFAFFQKFRIGSAISSAEYYAVRHGSSLSSTTADAMRTTLETIVRSTLGSSSSITVSILINNSTTASDASQYYCVSGYPPTYTSTGTSQTTCSTNLTSGKFVTIRVTEQVNSLILSPGFLTSIYALDRSFVARVD